ncbi:MAG: superoxide dismutase [Candidatus Phytoplasma asteris]|uniref:Superoxide dismutase n=4 Tax=Candidatus Phytoplasma TaxID=33926 RepID=K7ZQ12_ONYPH|nr:superoxide dismutase ['Chrysanthemum coronarium' phytoplasma]TKA87771.1 MAG: superoxide dismutase [Periwinkle leaf yellowing phytoplasma]WEX19792.1 MAG: superoxide dismutase [Candidatus Phytoplasma asteris]BAM66624.1 superoxide dismutase [Onion yellows phytoplasma OY-W]GAK74104.1 superoxide dismutase ['Chrysanthemum coronarium' phytoplasma]
MNFTLLSLPYQYDALEPFFDTKTMQLHHLKHHQTYINNLNDALKKHPQLNLSLEQMLTDLSLVPQDIRQTVRNNGGGHFNHSFFWTILKVNNGNTPQGLLKEMIDCEFGSIDSFKDKFANAAKTIFGSGWAWLVLTPQQKLAITFTPNQDVVLNQGTPLLGLDVWEHAYYLSYQNRRVDYIEAFFSVLDWEKVQNNLTQALK